MDMLDPSPTLAEMEEAYRHLHNLQAQYQSFGVLKSALETYITVKRTSEETEHALDDLKTMLEDMQGKQAALATQYAALEEEYTAKHDALEAVYRERQQAREVQAEEEGALLNQALVALREALEETKTELVTAQDAAIAQVEMAAALRAKDFQAELAQLAQSRQELVTDVEQLTAQRDTLREALESIVRRVGDGERV